MDKQVKIIRIDASKIMDANGNPINITSASALRQWLIKQYSGREVVVKDNGKKVRFIRKGLQDSIKRRGTEQRQVYAELDNLLENSVYYGNESGDARHPYIERQDIYYAIAEIGGSIFGVRIKVDIEKGVENGTYKDHKIIRIDDLAETTLKNRPPRT